MRMISFAAGFALAAVACGAFYAEADDHWIATQGSVPALGDIDGKAYYLPDCALPAHLVQTATGFICDVLPSQSFEEKSEFQARAQICAKGAAQAGRPPADEWKRMKNAALDREAIPRSRSSEYEYDHIIPRCLGGSNELSNLQLQLWSVARVKDDLERFVCKQYCAGYISLDDARKMFSK